MNIMYEYCDKDSFASVMEYFNSTKYSDDLRVRAMAVLLYNLRVLLNLCDSTGKSPHGFSCQLVRQSGYPVSYKLELFGIYYSNAKYFTKLFSEDNPSNIYHFKNKQSNFPSTPSHTILIEQSLLDILKNIKLELSKYTKQYKDMIILSNDNIEMFSLCKKQSKQGLVESDVDVVVIKNYLFKNKLTYISDGLMNRVESLLLLKSVEKVLPRERVFSL